jgi:DNA-directed RNA polymerase subunit RPC12/RpoP
MSVNQDCDMKSPPREITVICPKCWAEYRDWIRPSINLALDDFDEEYLDQATSATCPKCMHKVSIDVLIVREDGVWELGSE